MTIRTLTLVVALVAIVAFIALNWSAIVTKTPPSLGVATVRAPLGTVMPGLSTLFASLFLVFVIYSKTSGFFKERHHLREIRSTRDACYHMDRSRSTKSKRRN